MLEERPFCTMLEVFCANFIDIAQTSDPAQLVQWPIALLHGIYSVFPTPQVLGHNRQDTITNKKLESVEGLWAVRKEVLGWMVDGATWCIELAHEKKSTLMQSCKKLGA